MSDKSETQRKPMDWEVYLPQDDVNSQVNVANAKIICRQLNTDPVINNNQCNRGFARGVNTMVTGYLGSADANCKPVKVSESGNTGFGVAVATGGPCQDLTTLDSTLSGRKGGDATACFNALTPELTTQPKTEAEWRQTWNIDSTGLNSEMNQPTVLYPNGKPVEPNLNGYAFDGNIQSTGTTNSPEVPSGFPADSSASYYSGDNMGMSRSCTRVLSDRNVAACQSVTDGKCTFMQ